MARLDKPHVRGRVQTQERAAEVMAICEARGWYVTLELAPDRPEDVSDIERQLAGVPRERAVPVRERPQVQEVPRGVKARGAPAPFAVAGVTSDVMELGDEVTWEAVHLGFRARR